MAEQKTGPKISDKEKQIKEILAAPNLNEKIVELVDAIIACALEKKASDMHIEPTRGETEVRFRIDGIMQRVLTLPKQKHPAIVARFKILADLRIDEYRRPQDGRIELTDETTTSLRISTMPTIYGEKLALRLLTDSVENYNIEQLGFSEEQKEVLMRNIEKPFGMIVTSGPTGSGKTTTLYALLNLLKKDRFNVSTLEDPVEHALNGINQVQINQDFDLTFAAGLRSLLRQDPDIIMVGEIRDSETAVMAANAALTGHLVFTTMHTNDAASAFLRFLEMNVDDFVVGSVVNLVIAQRLVRRVCPHCVRKQPLEESIIKKILARKDLQASFKTLGISQSDIQGGKFASGAGCEKCFHSGYDGRIGIFEMIELDKGIHDLILEHANAEELKKAARSSGYIEMINDGLKKVRDGQTTFEELLRVTRNN